MFLDKLLEQDTIAKEGLADLIEDSRKVVVTKQVVDMAVTLAEQGDEKIAKVAPFTVWPDYDTWIEFELHSPEGSTQVGFYFYGKGGEALRKDSVTVGIGMMYVQNSGHDEVKWIPVKYDLENYRLDFADHHTIAKSRAQAMGYSKEAERFFDQFAQKIDMADIFSMTFETAAVRNTIKPILIAILALMNSPKLVTRRPKDMTKFNARRLKRGKYPYHAHHEAVINVDRLRYDEAHNTNTGAEKALHFVRAHPRFYIHPRYKQASVTIVEPHWRGNPELGIMNTRYRVEKKAQRA